MESFDDFSDDIQEQELFEHHHIEVDKGQNLLRIDKFLLTRLPDVSRTKIQLAAEAGNILVNQKAVKSNYKVKPGDEISIVLPYPPRVLELIPQNIPIDILYEDEHLLVLNKKAGMVVHPGYGNYTGTLVNALIYHFEHLPGLKGDVPRPGLVHRLDKHTSGVMVVAKSELALNDLARQFFERSISRLYHALVWGDVKQDSGTVTGHIGRSSKDRKVFTVYMDGEQGKHAVTHYTVLERLGYVSLVQCKLETGRTHQIRVHMKHIGHTLFNDLEYGGNTLLKGTTFANYRQFVENCFALLPGQALHAQTLGFIHPATQKELFFEAPLPEDFQEVLIRWKNYTNEEK